MRGAQATLRCPPRLEARTGGNTHRFWSLASARRKLGYAPEDDSQVNFADKIAALARAAKRR